MPNYDYMCISCNQYTTLKRAIDDRDNIVLCFVCNSETRRVLNSVNAVFKGGGFYSTDNPKPPKKRN